MCRTVPADVSCRQPPWTPLSATVPTLHCARARGTIKSPPRWLVPKVTRTSPAHDSCRHVVCTSTSGFTTPSQPAPITILSRRLFSSALHGHSGRPHTEIDALTHVSIMVCRSSALPAPSTAHWCTTTSMVSSLPPAPESFTTTMYHVIHATYAVCTKQTSTVSSPNSLKDVFFPTFFAFSSTRVDATLLPTTSTKTTLLAR